MLQRRNGEEGVPINRLMQFLRLSFCAWSWHSRFEQLFVRYP